MKVRQQRFLRIFPALAMFAAVLMQSPAGAQRAARTELGPLATFAPDQAAQGKTLYGQQCGSCHGRSLSGSEFAAPLNGNAFSLNWGGKPAAELFTFIRTRMPQPLWDP